MANAWMVRAGEGGYVVNDFRKKNVVAIGWDALPDLSPIRDRDELRKLVDEKYADNRPGQRRTSLGQISVFRLDMKTGEMAVTANPQTREYLIGTITGDYDFQPGLIKDYPHIRKVVKYYFSVARMPWVRVYTPCFRGKG